MKIFYLAKQNECMASVYSIDLALLRGIMKKFDRVIATTYQNLVVDSNLNTAAYKASEVLRFLKKGQHALDNVVTGIVENPEILGKDIDVLSVNIPSSCFMIAGDAGEGLDRIILSEDLVYAMINGTYDSLKACKRLIDMSKNDPAIELKQLYKAILNSNNLKSYLSKDAIDGIDRELLDIYKREDKD